MSRNFELMQDIERERALRSNVVVDSAFPKQARDRKQAERSQVATDATLGLVQRIFLQQGPEPPRLVVFAAIEHGNGCSQIARSVAETIAGNAPGRVCLMEANFRSPGRPLMFGAPNYLGLTDALLKPGNVRSFMTPVSNESLWLLSPGSPEVDSPGLLNSERMRARTAELRREFDFVIVDAPPLTSYPDAIALAKLSDGMVVVLEAGSTRREAARRVVENVRASRIEILGAVMNKRTFPIPDRIYKKL